MQQPSPMPSAALVTVGEVAGLLAISTRQVWRLTAMGSLPPPVRLSGRLVRWRLTDLEAYVQSLVGE